MLPSYARQRVLGKQVHHCKSDAAVWLPRGMNAALATGHNT